MSEFERLLNEVILNERLAARENETPHPISYRQEAGKSRAALIAHHERALAERDARIAELEKMLNEPVHLSEWQRAMTRIAELEPDAERYRHIRDNDYFAVSAKEPYTWEYMVGDELDAAIDASRKGVSDE